MVSPTRLKSGTTSIRIADVTVLDMQDGFLHNTGIATHKEHKMTQQQMGPKISKIIDGMVASGVARPQAVAVAMAIEHALTCPQYQAEFGTFLQTNLQDFVDTVYTS